MTLLNFSHNRTRLFFAALPIAIFIASCAAPEPSRETFSDNQTFRENEIVVEEESPPPRAEPLSATGNQPYSVLGKHYRPLATAEGFVQRGIASWYGGDFHGRRTSSGERYDMHAMTAAHPLLPLPSYARVTVLDGGRSVVVRINDRGPFVHGRIIDLSYAAARKLGIARGGLARVEVRALSSQEDAYAAAVADGTFDDDEFNESPRLNNINNPRGEVWIQIGAYSRHDNAAAVRRRVLQAGYPAESLQAGDESENQNQNENGGALYRVRAGPFADYAQAQTARRKLEALLGWRLTTVNE